MMLKEHGLWNEMDQNFNSSSSTFSLATVGKLPTCLRLQLVTSKRGGINDVQDSDMLRNQAENTGGRWRYVVMQEGEGHW